MRKEVLYSMLAAAAFTPGVANADAVVNVSVENAQATGGQYNKTDQVYVSPNGTAITASLGSFVAGTYDVTIGKIDATNGKVTVEVNGKKATTDGTTNNESVTITGLKLTNETTLDLTATTAAIGDNKSFSIGEVKVALDTDNAEFKAKVATIQKVITDNTNKINTWQNNGFNEDDANAILTEIAKLQSDLAAIQNDENGTLGGYELYKKYNLDNAVDNNNALITGANNQLKVAEDKYTAQLNKLLTDVTGAKAYTDLKTAYENAVQQSKYTTDWTTLQGLITDYNVDLTKSSLESDYKAKVAAISKAITDLQTKIDGDDAENTTAYTTIKANYEKAYSDGGDILTSLADNIKEANLEKSGKSNGYNKLLQAGRAKVSDLLAKLAKVGAAIEASNTNKTSVADKTAQQAQIDDFAKQLTDAKTLYTETLKNKLADLDATYEVQYQKITDADTNYKDVIANYGTERTALVTAVQGVYDAIDAALEKAKSGDNGAALQADDLLTTATAAVTTAENALVAKAQPAQALFTAKAGATAKVTDLTGKLTAAKEKVGALKYGDVVAETTYWKTWASGISDDIENKITKPANAANDATAEVFTNLENNASAIQTAINEYQTETAAAAAKFAEVKTAVDKASRDLNAAKDKVSILPIYEDNSNSTVDATYNYKQKVEAAEAEIKTANDAITAALANTEANVNKANTDAVKALSFNPENANAVVAYINANYEKDRDAWQANADAEALAAQKLAVKATIDGLNARTEEIKGYIANTDKPLGLKTDEISAALTEATKDYPSTDELNAAIGDDATAEQFNPVLARVTAVNEAVSKLYTEQVQPALTRVSKNKAKLTEAKNYLAEAVQSTDGWGEEQNVIRKHWNQNYDTVPGEMTPKNELAQLNELIVSINTDYEKIDKESTGAIQKAYATETLPEEYDKTIKASIDALKGRINDALTTADNLKKNYDSRNKQDIEQAKITDNISSARTAAAANDPVQGAEDGYYGKLLDSYATQANTIATTIKDNYNNQNSVSTEEAVINTRIKNLNDKIAKVAEDAKKNLESYNKLTPIETEVKNTWSKRSTDLASVVETSTLRATQDKLNGYLDELEAQKTKDKEAYENGTAAENEADYTTALRNIESDINTLVDNATDPDSIKAQVTKDNNGMMTAITNEYNTAYKAFKAATATVDSYKNLKSTGAQAALGTVQTQYDELNDYLYGTASKELSEKLTKARDDFDKTNSPTVFDKDSTYVGEFRTLTENIKSKEAEFKTNISNALTTAVGETLTGYENAIKDDKNVAATYNLTDDANKAKVFDDIAKKVAEASDAIKAADITTLDKKLADLEANFTTELKAALDSAATLDLDGYIKKQENDITDGKKYLTDNGYDLTAYNATVANTLGKARAALADDTSNSDQYSTIKGYVDSYIANNEYKTAQANDANLAKVNAAIAQSQTDLTKAQEAVSVYAVAGEFETQFDALQETLNGYKDKANAKDFANLPTVDQAKKVGTDATALAKTDNGEALYNAEYDYLTKRLAEVTAAYNVWVAADTANAKNSAEKKAEIDAIKTAVNKAGAKASDLLEQEVAIKAQLSVLATPEDIAEAKKDLTDALNGVKSEFADGILDDVKEVYQSKIDDISTQKTSLETAINSSENIIFEKDQYTAKIAALVTKSETLATDITNANNAKKQEIAAEEAAEQDLQGKIDDLTQSVKDSQDKLNTYTAPKAKAGMFQAKYNLLTDKIKEVQDVLDAAKTAKNAKANKSNIETSITNAKTYVDNLVKEIEVAAAYRQASYELETLKSNYDALDVKVKNLNKDLYLKSDIADFESRRDNINTEISTLASNIENDYSTDASETKLADRQATITNIQSKIDKLNNDIKANTTTIDGDVNGDGNVDVYDVQEVIKRIGSSVSTENSVYDVNGDGSIDILDIQEVIKNLK